MTQTPMIVWGAIALLVTLLGSLHGMILLRLIHRLDRMEDELAKISEAITNLRERTARLDG